jgi:hypothetical protein
MRTAKASLLASVAAVGSEALPLRNQEYQIKSKALEDLIRQRLVEAEAKKQGIK